MDKLVVVMSHKLNEDQVVDANVSLGVKKVIQITGLVADAAKQIDPEASHEQIRGIAADIAGTAKSMGATHFSLMGEPALVCAAAHFAEKMGMTFVQSTTKRVSEDIPQEDGSIKKVATFKHVMWRKWN